MVLAPQRLKLNDLGNSLALRSPTGRTEIVQSLSHVWVAADGLATIAIDPLDEGLLKAIEESR